MISSSRSVIILYYTKESVIILYHRILLVLVKMVILMGRFNLAGPLELVGSCTVPCALTL